MKNELLNQKQLSPQPAKSASIKNNSNASSKSSDIVDKAIASKKASKSKKKTQSTKVQQPILMVEFDESDIEEDEKEDDTSDIEDHTYLVDGDDAPASPLDSFQDDIWFDAQEFDEAQWKLDEVPFQPVVGLCKNVTIKKSEETALKKKRLGIVATHHKVTLCMPLGLIKRPVHVLSNCHSAHGTIADSSVEHWYPTSEGKQKITVFMPLKFIVKMSNFFMGAVDRFDQYRAYIK